MTVEVYEISNSVSDVQIPTFHHYEKDSPRITYANIDIAVDDREDFTKSNSEIRYDEEIPQEKDIEQRHLIKQ